MNDELITLNEVLNSVQSIYLYQDETSNVWATWGYSAFLLSRMDGGKCLTSFSGKSKFLVPVLRQLILKELSKTI